MFAIGVILLILGYFFGISLLMTVGGVLLLVGAVLWVLGETGHAVGGRRWY